jgi:hypothetical protein
VPANLAAFDGRGYVILVCCVWAVSARFGDHAELRLVRTLTFESANFVGYMEERPRRIA